MKTFILPLLFIFSGICHAKVQCDYGGVQVALRNSADSLHHSKPVRYIDFANDAPFADALKRMSDVGVSNAQVQHVWALAIQKLCGEKAAEITPDSVGPTQNLNGLLELLGF